jgi:hypothetical protein
MSDPDDGLENFLRRWSRRKQTAALRARDQGSEDEPADAAKTEIESPVDGTTANPSDPPIFDLATLPPIESITAATDIRAFLAPGVPVELSRAALRRAWTSDPTIREFIGLAENQWDFTRPDTVPGFGSLEITPELRRLISQLVGDAPKEPSPPRMPIWQSNQRTAGTSGSASPTPVGMGGDHRAAAEWPQRQPLAQVDDDDDAAAQCGGQDVDAGTPSARRKHGSAMPE